MGEHADRVALVIGGSRGIGQASALELARQGAAVVVHGFSLDEANLTSDRIVAEGGRSIAVHGDIVHPDVVERAVQAAVTAFGNLDVLVVTAGVQRYGDAVETTIDVWDEVMNVNVRGAYLAAHFALPHLRTRAGSIVIVASVQGTASQKDVVAYTASKGALIAMTRALAVDEASHGVRVNSVSPGSVDTPMLRFAAASNSSGTPQAVESLIQAWGLSHPLGRVGQPNEIGQVISFLASSRASFVTGEDLRVDGGLLAQLPAALPE